MKVGDLVRFKRDIVGLEHAVGIILQEDSENTVTVKWWNHYEHKAEEDTDFLEIFSESR